jgi:hypothetical protein
VPEFFLPWRGVLGEGARLEYRPALLGGARVHYTQSKVGVDRWETVSLLASLAEEPGDDLWDKATPLPGEEPELEKDPAPGAGFSPLPPAAGRAKSYEAWKKGFADALYRNRSLVLYRCPSLNQVSRPGETEGDFRVRLAQAAREKRDQDVESLRKRYAPKAASLQDRIARAEQRTEVEKSQYDQQKIQTAISMGATILGAFFGRKLTSAGNVGRATTAMRGVGRAAREREDLGRALESAEELRGQLLALEAELQEEISGIQRSTDPMALSMEEIAIHPRKADISITRLALVWTPWKVNRDGTSGPAH